MRNFRKIISPTLTAALLTLQLAPGFLVPKKAQAIIASGAPAIDVLGQYDANGYAGNPVKSFTGSSALGGVSSFGLSSPYDNLVDTTNHRLFVADYYNNRVAVYDLDSNNQLQDRNIDYALGQQDLFSSVATVTQSGMKGPQGLAWDSSNSRLFVAETYNSRVLVFDLSSGITTGMGASFVLGQSSFTSSSYGLTSTTMNWPTGLAWDSSNSRLFVVDNGNSRILSFDLSGGITNGMAASNVLGQPNFTSWDWGTTDSTTSSVISAYWDAAGSRLFAADYYNNRVLVYDLATIADGEPAVNVLGQADFTSSGSATSSTGMNNPNGLSYDGGNSRLFVSDYGNSRVLVYDLATIADGEPAANVLGQTDFTSSGYGTTSTQIAYPYGNMSWDSGNSYLYLSDNGNNRVLVFDLSGGVTDGMAASDVLGQAASVSTTFPRTFTGTSFTKGNANGGPFAQAGFLWPKSTVYDSENKRLFVADEGSRVQVFDTDQYGKPNSVVPSYVIGQADAFSMVATVTQSGTYGPQDLAWDGVNSRLFVLDSAHRILVFDLSGGITTGMNASYVIGQTDFTSSSSGTTDSNFLYPLGLAYDSVNSRLFVADAYNYRVLVFDLSGGITNGMAASNVLGQTNFTSRTLATSQTGMRYVMGVEWDGTNSRLFVTDNSSRRVTVFDLSGGITNGMAASYVLGQTTFTAASQATTSTGMRAPTATSWDGTNERLFVYDGGNYRVTVFDLSGGITNGMAASYVLGQPDFTTGTLGSSSTKLSGGYDLTYITGADRLLVADSANHRVLTFDVATAAGTLVSTTTNRVSLSRLAAGASSDFSLSFDLAHVVSSTLTVTFPAGFTVTAPATAGASSSCLSNFGYTSNTLTADKTLCGGPITLGGATITLPSTPGAYTITWVNDDPGSATIIIVSNDQISITATVAPTVSFLAVAQPAASTCANTSDLTGSDYTLALGTLNVATITESESLNADSDTVERICTQGSTNATSGMAVTVKNANGSSGLVSSSVPADTIPSSASGQLAAGTPGYGVCVRGSSLASDSGLTPTGADPTATGDFSTYECESASGNIVALTGSAQGLWSAAGPTQDATAAIWVRVAISAVQPAHNDYADSLTFVATATY